MPPKYIKF